MIRVVAVGDNCIDRYIEEKKSYAGGNALNVAVYLQELGVKTSFVSIVGDDANGDFMIKEIQRKNVDISNLVVGKGKTAETIIKLVANDRVFDRYDPGVMENFRLNDKMIKFIEGHEFVHTSIDSKILDRILDLRDIKISCDFSNELNNIWTKKLAPKLNVAFFSYEKDDKFIRDYMKEIYDLGTEIVVVTLGSNGSLGFDGNKFYKKSVLDETVIDTLGAGDSFIAGFLCGLLSRNTIVNSMEMGSAKASLTIQHSGAW